MLNSLVVTINMTSLIDSIKFNEYSTLRARDIEIKTYSLGNKAGSTIMA